MKFKIIDFLFVFLIFNLFFYFCDFISYTPSFFNLFKFNNEPIFTESKKGIENLKEKENEISYSSLKELSDTRQQLLLNNEKYILELQNQLNEEKNKTIQVEENLNEKIDSNKINKDSLEQQINNFKDEITILKKREIRFK